MWLRVCEYKGHVTAGCAHLLGPEGEAFAALGLDGVVTGRPPLLIRVGCHPDVLEREATARLQKALGRRQHDGPGVSHQLVRHRLACTGVQEQSLNGSNRR